MAIKYKIGTNTTTITDIQTTSEREINYAKTSSGTYLWARPTSIDLQFPWDAFSAWALVRLSGSKHPDAPQGTVWTQNTKATSGTNTYSFSNVYYGDNLRFDYTAKPGAIIGQKNNYEFTIDPTFNISNIGVEKSELPDPSAELSSQWDFEEGDWNTVQSASNRDEFTLTVTKPASAKALATKVYATIINAECFYKKGWNVITYRNSYADVYYGSTELSRTDMILIGTIPAGTLSKDFTLKVSCSGANYWWPKGVWLRVNIELSSSDHYFTSNTRYRHVREGTFASNGGGGGGGGGGLGPVSRL